MPRRYRPREIERIKIHLGYEFNHYHGDHAIFRKLGSPSISIPGSRQELARGTPGSIIRAMGLTRREFDRIAEEVL